jgi:hypothetical protein
MKWKCAYLLGMLSNHGFVVMQSPAGKDVGTEAEEYWLLVAISRQLLVKTQQTEKTWRVL